MAFRVIQPAGEVRGFKVIKPAHRPGAADDVAGGLETLYGSIPFLNDIRDNMGAAGKTITDLAQGKSSYKRPETIGEAVRGVPEAFRATGEDFANNRRAGQQRRRGQAADFMDRRPLAANAVKGVGLAAQVAPAMLTGGASAAPTMAANAPRGLMGATARALKPTADAAVVGGLGAQITGLGGDGTLEQRLDTANRTTLPAMAMGAAIPGSIALASKGRRVGADMMQGAGRTTARLANRASGGRILDPRQEAAKRLGEALKADGLGPQQVRAALTEWQTSGASSPALMDLAGENTRSLLRAASSKPGAARNAAVGYADQVTGDLQGNAIARTRELTMDRRPVKAVADEVRGARGAAAREQYPAFADERVPVTDDLLSATDGTSDWMRGAAQLARAERRPDVLAEIEALSSGGSLDDVSAGTLDYMRRALRDASGEAFSGGKGGLGAALKGRSQEIEGALMDVPGFDQARSTYRGFSQQLDALDEGGKVLNEVPEDFAAAIGKLGDEARPMAEIGAREALETAIGRPAEGSTGTLNRIATSTNTGRNLEEVFPPEFVDRYRGALTNEMDRVRNARFVSPNTGSQTAPRLADEGLVELPPMSKLGIAKALFDKLQRGITLTPQEREALVELGTTIVRTGDDLPRIPTTPQAMRLMAPAQRQALSRALAQYQGQSMARPAE